MRAQLMGGPADGELREIQDPAPPTLIVVTPGNPEPPVHLDATLASARISLIEYTYQRGRAPRPGEGLRYHYHQERIRT